MLQLSYYIKNKIEPHIMMSLINYYNDSIALVMNNNEYSDIFKTSIGVKQRGLLSPKLFAMDIEDPITEIETPEAGIKINDMKIDIMLQMTYS